jgi:hypothetical protein
VDKEEASTRIKTTDSQENSNIYKQPGRPQGIKKAERNNHS